MSERPDPIFDEMPRILDLHGVRYVVSGGMASRVHVDPPVTFDLDTSHTDDQALITPEPSEASLARVAAALKEMDALVPTRAYGVNPLQLNDLVAQAVEFRLTAAPRSLMSRLDTLAPFGR